jgi:hypothetical protein
MERIECYGVIKEIYAMKEQNEKKPRAPRKVPATEDASIADAPDELTTTYLVESEEGPENKTEFPDEWISIAAYYIWKSDGQPEGRDDEYWERARADLMKLRKEGNLPTGR